MKLKSYPFSLIAVLCILLGYGVFFSIVGIGTIVGIILFLGAIIISIIGINKESSRFPAISANVISIISLVLALVIIINLVSTWNSGSNSLDMM